MIRDQACCAQCASKTTRLGSAFIGPPTPQAGGGGIYATAPLPASTAALEQYAYDVTPAGTGVYGTAPLPASTAALEKYADSFPDPNPPASVDWTTVALIAALSFAGLAVLQSAGGRR